MENRFPIIATVLILLAAAVLGALFWSSGKEKSAVRKTPAAVAGPAVAKPQTPTASPAPEATADARPTPIAQPRPVAVPLDGSDEAIVASVAALAHGRELINLLTEEEIARKIVRAIYGLSEGRIVRQYRPIASPPGQFNANKIGRQTAKSQQELYRISRANYSRYSSYIALFSLINDDTLIDLYALYRPTLEEAYRELGIGEGDFHSTLIKAVDMLLQAPTFDRAILLVRPSVKFQFHDPELEKLPSAHKLMLRMGTENSEALKLELTSFKNRLASL